MGGLGLEGAASEDVQGLWAAGECGSAWEVEVERDEARTGAGDGEEGEKREAGAGVRMTGGWWSSSGVRGGAV